MSPALKLASPLAVLLSNTLWNTVPFVSLDYSGYELSWLEASSSLGAELRRLKISFKDYGIDSSSWKDDTLRDLPFLWWSFACLFWF